MVDLKKLSIRELAHEFQKEIIEIVAAHPRKYWGWFLMLASAFIVGTIVLNGYLFIIFNATTIPALPGDLGAEGISINKSALGEVIDVIDKRALEFDRVLRSTVPLDPAL
ncbi:hypothetical protein IIA95_00640 [Patescibacteria group bacterium]|nr:hypothetical protein [Patescibacteria group bacterium]